MKIKYPCGCIADIWSLIGIDSETKDADVKLVFCKGHKERIAELVKELDVELG